MTEQMQGFRNGNELCDEHYSKVVTYIQSDLVLLQTFGYIGMGVAGIMGLSITLSMLFSDEASMVPAIIRWITAGFSFIAMCAVLVVLFFFTRHFKKQLDLMKNQKFTWKYGVLTKEPYGVLRNNNGIVLKIDDINCIYRENAHTLVGVKEGDPFLMIAFEKVMYALRV